MAEKAKQAPRLCLAHRVWAIGAFAREDNLLCVRRRKYVLTTTHSDHAYSIYPRLTEDLGIGDANDTPLAGTLEINRRLTTAQASENLLIEIGVGLKSRPHPRGMTLPLRAASILAYREG